MPNTTEITQTAQTNIELVLKVIDIIAWPVTALILALIIILIFRKPFISLINRITEIDHKGTTLKTQAQQQTSIENQENNQISSVEKAISLFKDETIEKFRTTIKDQSNIEKLTSDKEKVERLLKYSIILYIIKDFETIYGAIFGSQIMILQQLNTNIPETVSSLQRYYNNAKSQNPDFYNSYSYEQYLNFLSAQQLITQEGANVKISVLGVDFLKYLIETNKLLNKLN